MFFCQAANLGPTETADLGEYLEVKLAEIQTRNTDSDLKQHEKFLEFQAKVNQENDSGKIGPKLQILGYLPTRGVARKCYLPGSEVTYPDFRENLREWAQSMNIILKLDSDRAMRLLAMQLDQDGRIAVCELHSISVVCNS